MQAAIDRVMQTYTMIVNLSVDEEQAARQKVTTYLAGKPEADEHALAVEGLRYLRSVREYLGLKMNDTFERKVITPAEREARKAFKEVDAAKAMTEHERAQKAFHENRERLESFTAGPRD